MAAIYVAGINSSPQGVAVWDGTNNQEVADWASRGSFEWEVDETSTTSTELVIRRYVYALPGVPAHYEYTHINVNDWVLTSGSLLAKDGKWVSDKYGRPLHLEYLLGDPSQATPV